MIRFISSTDTKLLRTINQYNFDGLLENPYIHGLVFDNIGYIVYQYIAPQVEIIHIATHPQHRHRGLGYTMMMALENSLPDDSEILCEVDCLNKKAIGLYEKFGMTRFSLRPQYYDNGNDAWMMSKFLHKAG